MLCSPLPPPTTTTTTTTDLTGTRRLVDALDRDNNWMPAVVKPTAWLGDRDLPLSAQNNGDGSGGNGSGGGGSGSSSSSTGGTTGGINNNTTATTTTTTSSSSTTNKPPKPLPPAHKILYSTGLPRPAYVYTTSGTHQTDSDVNRLEANYQTTQAIIIR